MLNRSFCFVAISGVGNCDFVSLYISFIKTSRHSWDVFISLSLGSNSGDHVTAPPLGTLPVALPDKYTRYAGFTPYVLICTVTCVCLGHHLRFHSDPPKLNRLTTYRSHLTLGKIEPCKCTVQSAETGGFKYH
jgi:hypothetical protein